MKHFPIIALLSLVLTMQVNAQQLFRSVADAMRSLPALPTAEQIISDQAKEQYTESQLNPFSQAVEQSMLYTATEYSAITARMQSANHRQSERSQSAMQQYNKNVEAGLMPSQQEMMQILMSSGIDLNSASEQQIMDAVAGAVSKKWGISKDEYLKIVSMAQRNEKQAEEYMKANHPDLYKRLYATNAGYSQQADEGEDPRNARFEQIGDELNALQEQLSAVLSNYREPADLQEDNVQDVQTEAKRWLEAPTAYQHELKAVFDKVAALETENEQLGQQGAPDNVLYLMNKQRTLMFINQLMQLITPYRDALNFPLQVQPEGVEGAG